MILGEICDELQTAQHKTLVTLNVKNLLQYAHSILLYDVRIYIFIFRA